MLATCGIHRPEWSCENTSYCLLFLADSSKEKYNGQHRPTHLHKGVTHTVQRIVTFVKRLTRFCLQSLQHRFVAWTAPITTSLLLLTLTDHTRSKSELVAENALLRKTLIILRRQVKRPAWTKTDRMLLVLLANMVRTWKQSLFIILTTPYQAPRANAICERFLGSVRRECLDHLLMLQEKQLQRVLNTYVMYFNRARPHQGIKQQSPEQKAGSVPAQHASSKVISLPVLGGLHHD